MNTCANSVDISTAAYPVARGGETPTLALHDLRVEQCSRERAAAFVEQHHYSKSAFGVTTTVCFEVLHNARQVGAAMFGLPAGMGVARKYAPHGSLLELRRFCLVDDMPKNAESRTLGVMLRALKRQGVKCVLSYADPAHGHLGTIYKAAGFSYHGTTASRKHILWKNKKYPDRNVHQTKFPFHLELRAALAEGTAVRIKIPGKHIFTKNL